MKTQMPIDLSIHQLELLFILFDDDHSELKVPLGSTRTPTVAELLRFPNPCTYKRHLGTDSVSQPSERAPYVRKMHVWNDFTAKNLRSELAGVYG